MRRTATAASSSSSPDWLSLAKWCAGCAAPTQQSDYSKGQRKQPAGRRRCRRCMDAKTELKSFAEIREILDKNAQALAEWRERMERQRGNSNLLDQLPADSFGLICDVLYRDDPPWLAPRTRLELADEAESDDPGDEDYDDGDPDYDDGDDRGSDDGGDGGSDGGSNGGGDAGSDSSSDAGSGDGSDDGSDDGGAGAECAYAERRRTDHEAALRMCGRLACVSRAARALVTGWSAAAIEHRKMHIAVEPGMAYARAALKHKARAREDEDANEDVDADGISRGLAGVAELDGIVLDSTKAITLLPGPGLADYLDRTTCDGYERMRKEFGRLDHNGTGRRRRWKTSASCTSITAADSTLCARDCSLGCASLARSPSTATVIRGSSGRGRTLWRGRPSTTTRALSPCSNDFPIASSRMSAGCAAGMANRTMVRLRATP